MSAELPFKGTQGHSGSDTSQARAVHDARSGKAATRQAEALRLIGIRGIVGLTVSEIRRLTGWHHGEASSVLSCLHHGEKIARLAETRGRAKVYVLPEFVDDRDTESYGRRTVAQADAEHAETLSILRDMVDNDMSHDYSWPRSAALARLEHYGR